MLLAVRYLRLAEAVCYGLSFGHPKELIFSNHFRLKHSCRYQIIVFCVIQWSESSQSKFRNSDRKNIDQVQFVILCVFRNSRSAINCYASVFMQFYHWCDMTTWSTYALCIAPYGSLQFCDFLCSLLSFWVTLMAVAKIPHWIRHVLFVFGMFCLILPVHINHTGVIANIVPIVVGVLIVVGSWVSTAWTDSNPNLLQHVG
jgi:Protein of unknown function (DUF3522)